MPPSLVLLVIAAATARALNGPMDPPKSPPCAILEERCQCTPDLQEFVCRTAGFVEVPQNLPYSITKLDLTSNNITALNETSLSQYTHMEELILSENKLESIHPNSFAKNTQLKRLLLQGCSLSAIPVDALRPLVKLQTLNIGNNLIVSLPAAAFPPLDKLVVLYGAPSDGEMQKYRAFS